MTAALDFAALPPEVNSARMYAGAGAAPMLAAASAWNGLAAELRATALTYEAVLSALAGDEWFGPAAASMAAAATPYVVWLNATAVQAKQTGAQAEAAVTAYATAFAATVPPPLVAANRTQLAALVATNILGQNTPAIAATEAAYLEMWAQDAAAMYGYAGASAAATELDQFVAPQQITSPSGLTAQAAAVSQAADTSALGQHSALSQLMSAVPSALQGLSGADGGSGLADLATTALTGSGTSSWSEFMAAWGPNANVWNTITSTGLFTPGATIGTLSSLFGSAAMTDVADAAQVLVPSAGGGAVPLETRGLTALGSGSSGVVGKLSVPPAWAAATPPPGALHSALGGTPMVAPPPSGTPGMPGVPLGNLAGQPFGRAVPQYGFRPTVVARSPAAG